VLSTTRVTLQKVVHYTSALHTISFFFAAKGLELEEAHKRLSEKVATLLARGAIPFVIGGSNDQVFLNFGVNVKVYDMMPVASISK
jgi:tRNA A37 N6-isopentenylltransferase MiaA